MLVILHQSLHYIMNPPSDKYGLDMEEGQSRTLRSVDKMG